MPVCCLHQISRFEDRDCEAPRVWCGYSFTPDTCNMTEAQLADHDGGRPRYVGGIFGATPPSESPDSPYARWWASLPEGCSEPAQLTAAVKRRLGYQLLLFSLFLNSVTVVSRFAVGDAADEKRVESLQSTGALPLEDGSPNRSRQEAALQAHSVMMYNEPSKVLGKKRR